LKDLLRNKFEFMNQLRMPTSLIDSWQFWEFEEYTKLLNDKNKDEQERREKEEKQQKQSTPNMGNFNPGTLYNSVSVPKISPNFKF